MSEMKMLRVEDVMHIIGVGRPMATRIINQYGPKRKKGQKLMISEAQLKKYLGME